MKKKIDEIIAQLAARLIPACIDKQAAQMESWWMLEVLTGRTQEELIREETIALSPEQKKKLDAWVVERTKNNKPLQYILGTVPFCNLEILVEPPTLIPRPETEEWCSWLIDTLKPVADEKLVILDIGAGSGCIALALARAFPYATVIGVDLHDDAIRLCEKNKTHNNVANAIFIKSDLYSELLQYKGIVDLIVSNPPYISEHEYAALSEQVTKWEDKNALVAQDKGFAIHKKIIEGAATYLKPNSVLQTKSLPRLVLECGKGQAKGLVQLFAAGGFADVVAHDDLEGVKRWVTGTKP